MYLYLQLYFLLFVCILVDSISQVKLFIVSEHKSDHWVLVIDEVMCGIIVTKHKSDLFCLFMIEVYISVLLNEWGQEDCLHNVFYRVIPWL